jgi:hypothetical protein
LGKGRLHPDRGEHEGERRGELLAEFKKYYGPTMNAFEAAVASGRETDLHNELEALFNAQNANGSGPPTLIPAAYLRVTVST